MWFNQYPYININDLNLDFILKSIRDMKYEVENFVSINAIKYANPIQWDITKQYEKNTVVIDGQSGTAYLSVAPVPAGVALTRPEYWTVVFDLGSFVTRAAQNFSERWESETTLTATFSTPVGGWLVWGDVLYKAKVNITAGDSYVVGSNIEHFTMEDIYDALLQDITNAVAVETNNREIADGILQGNINATNATIGDLSNLTTSDTTSVVNAINSEVQARQNADTALQNQINNITPNGDVILISDSYGINSATPTRWSWFDKFASICDKNTYPFAVGGASFGGGNGGNTYEQLLDTSISTLTDAQKSKITTIIIGGGYNDAMYSVTEAALSTAIEAFVAKAKLNYPKLHDILFCFIANDASGVVTTASGNVNVNKYNIAVTMGQLSYYCTVHGMRYSNIPYIYFHDYNLMQADGIHPTQNGANVIGTGVYAAYVGTNEMCSNINVLTSFTGTNATVTNDATIRVLVNNHGINVTFGAFQASKPADDATAAVFTSDARTAILPRIACNYYISCNIGQYDVICRVTVEPLSDGRIQVTLKPITSVTWQTIKLDRTLLNLDPIHF